MEDRDKVLEKIEHLENIEGKTFNVLNDKVVEGATLESSFVEVIRDNSLNKVEIIREIKQLVEGLE
jgi:hypothetical protein